MRYLGIVLILLICSSFEALSNQQEPDGRLIIHLLDYMATDYGNAVANGQVTDEFEYSEMLEFASSIEELTIGFFEGKTHPSENPISLAKKLDSLAQAKSDPETISQTANALKLQILAIGNIRSSPLKWPDLSNGKKLYNANCVGCHGTLGLGDGPSSAGLDPSPTNFSNSELMSRKSPLQAYHTLSFGVEGTSMVAFEGFSEEQKWDLAFFIHTLRKSAFQNSPPEATISLDELASKSDLELEQIFDPQTISWFRNNKPVESAEKIHNLDFAIAMIGQAMTQVQNDNYSSARASCLKAYLEGVEPFELQLRAQDPDLTKRLETSLGQMRELVENQANPMLIEEKSQLVISLLHECEVLLTESSPSFWLTFSMSASVILREGLEAFLVIIIILSVLRKSGATKALKWVHFGWLSAIGTGIVAWLFADWMLQIGGLERELLEGVIALVAVAILFYIGFWMHSKSEAKRWNDFVQNRIQNLLNKESMFGLAVLSFLVVFREAFESVLFLSALNVDKTPNTSSALGLGVLFAFVIVVILAYLMLKFSKRIPIAQLFRASAMLIAVLSIILIGKGIHAIQETGYIGITALPYSFRIGVLGVYPTVETTLAQLFMLGLTTIVWKWQKRTTQRSLAE